MTSILNSPLALTAQALFVHADITGAYMNDLIPSKGGVPPSSFPPNIPIYSGHFHKPHVVTAPKSHVSIQYVGSPYQVSLAEAGQEKYLYVLDSDKGWRCVDTLKLDVGVRYHGYACLSDFMEGDVKGVRCGDRVVIKVLDRDLFDGKEEFHTKMDYLRKEIGAKVEIREMKTAPTVSSTEADSQAVLELEEMSPKAILTTFLKTEMQRNSILEEEASTLEHHGVLLLQELLEDEDTNDVQNSCKDHSATDLIFESISLQGFGCFQHEIAYPLSNRGLVLLKGKNQDHGFDSNGSGKSTLVMSALWALTGSMDARPSADAKVSDVVNDFAKSARVTLSGKVNTAPFTITRIKTQSKSFLSFFLDNHDYTRQSVKETQETIYEKLGILHPQVFSRTIFHGQHHSIQGLLESTDVKLKEELSYILPLDVWQRAAVFARAKSRSFTKKGAEVEGMRAIRLQDETSRKERLEEMKQVVERNKMALQKMEEKLRLDMENLAEEDEAQLKHNLESCRSSLQEIVDQLHDIEIQKRSWMEERQTSIQPFYQKFQNAKLSMEKGTKTLLEKERDLDRAQNSLTSEKLQWDHVMAKWGGGVDEDVILKQCPTCKQSIEEGHSHEALKASMTEEISLAEQSLSEAETRFQLATERYQQEQQQFLVVKNNTEDMQRVLQKEENEWDTMLNELDETMNQLRSHQATKTAELSDMAGKLQKLSDKNSIKALDELEFQRAKDAFLSSKTSYHALLKELEDIQHTLKTLQSDQESAKQNAAVMTRLADVFGPKGIQSFILQNVVHSLKITSQAYLDVLSDGSQRLDLEYDSNDKITRTAALRNPDGEWVTRPLSALSGGQWRRCSLSFSLGFSEMVAKRGCLRPSLLVLDEPFTHLDATGRLSVGRMLKQMVSEASGPLLDFVGDRNLNLSTIIIILQDLAAEEIVDSFDCIDEVVKDGGNSGVIVDR